MPNLPQPDDWRIVITGIGLTAPNGNSLAEFRQALLNGRSGVSPYEIRYIGATLAGICHFDELRYQKKKDLRRGTRAGSIAIYCAQEALADSRINWEKLDKSRVGVYLGITEHGNVETETEVYNLSQFNYDVKFWTHHHNPRTVANNPAGEVTLNLGITGPHYTIGAACAAGNAGLIQGAQQLQLGEIDVAFAGGVSESIHTFGIFAGFQSQGALASHTDPAQASRPFDLARNGIVVAEGGCVYLLERYRDALSRGATIYGELVGYAINSDATDPVLPNPQRQEECVRGALRRANLRPEQIDIVSTHATGTTAGDIHECQALRNVFGESEKTWINNTKSFIGHAMGAAGTLELAGNLPSFTDRLVHPTINVTQLDPECALPGLVINQPREVPQVNYILNNSFGMLGINSVVIIKRWSSDVNSGT
ncbi:MAG: beta-ketoacyl-[acyl-carrier-protein] synthase family protein [Pirellulales bacterium]|nr:beta-ketoacyl-[acyl-carrier-protein] synthase family protein [Pirellulales bacterium]